MELIHRSAVDAALRKAATLERMDPRGDPYGAAGQALEDYFKRHDQIVAGGEDVSGWISIATERRWINELRYQGRRSHARLDAPSAPGSTRTLGDMTASREPLVAELAELRERLRGIAGEQRRALAHLRARRVQERHVRVLEMALTGELAHEDIAAAVNAEFPASRGIRANTVAQIVGRLRNRLEEADTFPTVVARLRRIHRVA